MVNFGQNGEGVLWYRRWDQQGQSTGLAEDGNKFGGGTNNVHRILIHQGSPDLPILLPVLLGKFPQYIT
jgi:hypothetical protein